MLQKHICRHFVSVDLELWETSKKWQILSQTTTQLLLIFGTLKGEHLKKVIIGLFLVFLELLQRDLNGVDPFVGASLKTLFQ